MKQFLNNFLQIVQGISSLILRNLGSDNGFPYKVEIVAENLQVPWAIAISGDGKLYFTERSGSIRLIENSRLLAEPLFTFPDPFISTGEGGLMGIVLDPNFLINHSMYVMHSYADGSRIYNRVVRLAHSGDRAAINKVLLDKIPGGRIHNGGRLKIGPDQKLYITTGDAGNAAFAQNLSSPAGKILRIALDGSIPEDNPFAGSPVYSLGHRDPQGLAWNSNGILYESEHGQIAHDEVNIIRPGGNYGWPVVQGDEDTHNGYLQKALIHSGEETWAPSGIAFANGGSWKGKLLIAALRGEELLVLSLNESGKKPARMETWLKNEYGRLREVIWGNDGSIYLSTSNRDGRGALHAGDDKILRLVPADG